jgi:hypothetical protein
LSRLNFVHITKEQLESKLSLLAKPELAWGDHKMSASYNWVEVYLFQKMEQYLMDEQDLWSNGRMVDRVG